jgi:hypothetical protein
MFCPSCGQKSISTETKFCSRCGFLLTGAADLLETGGLLPKASVPADTSLSPRKKGLKQGLFIFLLTFLIVPIVAIFTMAIDVDPYAVAISAIALFMGGLLRMVYALMFESATPISPEATPGRPPNFLPQRPASAVLSPPQTDPAQSYPPPRSGNWRDTNDLQPISITEGTTRLLQHEEKP